MPAFSVIISAVVLAAIILIAADPAALIIFSF